MSAVRFSRVFIFFVSLVWVVSCGGKSGAEPGQVESENVELTPVVVESNECESQVQHNKTESSTTVTDFGDGSDGDFHLAAGAELALDEGIYNFSNVTTEVDSLLTLTPDHSGAQGTIQINSLGVCSFFGDIELHDYEGTLIINCYDSIAVGGAIINRSGDILLATANRTVSVQDQADSSGSVIVASSPDASFTEGTLTVDSISISENSFGSINVVENLAIDDGIVVVGEIEWDEIDWNDVDAEVIDLGEIDSSPVEPGELNTGNCE